MACMVMELCSGHIIGLYSTGSKGLQPLFPILRVQVLSTRNRPTHIASYGKSHKWVRNIARTFAKKCRTMFWLLPKFKHTYMRLVYISAVFLRGLKPFCAEFYFYVLTNSKIVEGTNVHVVGCVRVHSCKQECTSDPVIFRGLCRSTSTTKL